MLWPDGAVVDRLGRSCVPPAMLRVGAAVAGRRGRWARSLPPLSDGSSSQTPALLPPSSLKPNFHEYSMLLRFGDM